MLEQDLLPLEHHYMLDIISAEELKVFEEVRKTVPRILMTNPDASCHVICEILADMFSEVVHEKGYFGGTHQHSWLRLPVEDKKYFGRIIDPYPVACLGGPILVDTNCFTPWARMYFPLDWKLLDF